MTPVGARPARSSRPPHGPSGSGKPDARSPSSCKATQGSLTSGSWSTTPRDPTRRRAWRTASRPSPSSCKGACLMLPGHTGGEPARVASDRHDRLRDRLPHEPPRHVRPASACDVPLPRPDHRSRGRERAHRREVEARAGAPQRDVTDREPPRPRDATATKRAADRRGRPGIHGPVCKLPRRQAISGFASVGAAVMTLRGRERRRPLGRAGHTVARSQGTLKQAQS